MNDQSPLEVRSAALKTVDFPNRLIDLIAVPYDEWAAVEVDGRAVEESFAPGAFGNLTAQPDKPRFRVNLEHNLDPDRFVGRVVKTDALDPAGLRATVQMRRNDEGEQALIDAADGFYAASVGFKCSPDGQEWDRTRTRRRIVRAFFDHVALTGTPAYDGAAVLAVRKAPTLVTASATPNIDRILAERRAQAYPDFVR